MYIYSTYYVERYDVEDLQVVMKGSCWHDQFVKICFKLEFAELFAIVSVITAVVGTILDSGFKDVCCLFLPLLGKLTQSDTNKNQSVATTN